MFVEHGTLANFRSEILLILCASQNKLVLFSRVYMCFAFCLFVYNH